ncbi:MAG: GspE/PulE family protein [Candidatus Omnitrophota bacterium]|nr:GspE/PulE family protein [Candidatus Omnitrophota bacterium]
MALSLREKLTDILIKGNLIKKKDLDKAIEIQKISGGSLGEILVEQNLISQKSLMVAVSAQLDIPPINISKYKIDKEILKLIPEKVARQYSVLPLSRIGNVLTVVMSDPLNIFAIDDIKMITHFKVDIAIAPESDIKEAINAYYGATAHIQEISKILEEAKPEDEMEVVEEEKIDVSEVTEESQKAPIVKVVSLILNEAIKKRASDIHIEPCEKFLKIRYRIDGSLHDVLTLPKKNQNAVIARLKIMSKLDITETRMPQDGRFKISFEGKEIDFRVSVLPITFGGKVVMRILDKSSVSIGLDKLGFLPGPLSAFKTALSRPYGMILVTGPTGSGKSTTLYSIISQLNVPERNIITLEDPVEYETEGVTQIPARPEIGLTFATGLKSILRQSPDIIMVGEIRDFETADIAIKASLTGQLILSTLHTNDSAGAITRLIDMGVEPFLVASSLIMSSAQRLMRKICDNCKEEMEILPDVLQRLGVDPGILKKKGAISFYKGRGCSRCNDTGYYGRVGILETLLIDDPIRNMIMKKASSDQIKEYAIKEKHMMTLRDNAFENCMKGITTLEESLRVTSED